MLHDRDSFLGNVYVVTVSWLKKNKTAKSFSGWKIYTDPSPGRDRKGHSLELVEKGGLAGRWEQLSCSQQVKKFNC